MTFGTVKESVKCIWHIRHSILEKLTLPWPFDNDFNLRLVLGNRVRGQEAAPSPSSPMASSFTRKK